MLLRERIDVYCIIPNKHTVCAKFLTVTACNKYSYHWVLNG